MRYFFLAVCLLSLNTYAQGYTNWHGHLKYEWHLNGYNDDSVFYPYLGRDAFDQAGNFRLNFDWSNNAWSFDTDYQFYAEHGELNEARHELSAVGGMTNGQSSDDRRLMDLTREIKNSGRTRLVHRLDRFHVNYTSDTTVIRVGRQAVSWGNGLLYNPMDFLNPFDPTAVDKEYKTGDDMIYGQYLLPNGNDIQLLAVARRDVTTGDLETEEHSVGVKYHGFIGEREIDILLAEHYQDSVVGLGLSSSLAGAVWRSDVVYTRTDDDNYWSGVTNLSYSWMSFGKNTSGQIEYFYNGFGQPDGDYSDLQYNEELLLRIQRGELFNYSKQYLASSITLELTPLITFTPGVFHNLDDSSSLIQFIGNVNLSQNWQSFLAVNIPIGKKGTEYRGMRSGMDGRYISNQYSFIAQVAWYF